MEIEMKYRCNECGDLHDFEEDAHDCCRPTVTEVYLCPDCGEMHGNEYDARSCCTPDDVDPLRATMVTAAQREAAGQERLF